MDEAVPQVGMYQAQGDPDPPATKVGNWGV
ncbi:hypothetical protein P3T25_008356 [Paraburkholderia sp. GAS32]